MIVLDSSFLIGFYNDRDSHHEAACAVMDGFQEGRWGPGLLLEYVFLEVVTVLLSRRDLATAVQVAEALLRPPELEFVPCSDFFGQTLAAFQSQQSKRLSFTDAAIVTVAKERAGGLVATFDSEFRKIPGITVVPA